MYGDVPIAYAVEHRQHGILGKLLPVRVSENQVALLALAQFVEQAERRLRERDEVILVHLHAVAGDLPHGAGWKRAFDLGPLGADDFVRAAYREDQKAQRHRSATLGLSEFAQELRGLGVGQGGVVPNDALGTLRKLFAELLCKFGGIPEIEIVDVCVLRNDRLNSAAHSIGSLALGHPDQLKQFVNVARLDLGDRQLSDCRIGISPKRGWPLVAVLLAPSRPLRPNVGLGAFLERW